jgi:hypothetical protein
MIAKKTCTYPVKPTVVADDKVVTTECGKPAVRRFIFPEKTAWACREHEDLYEALQELLKTWMTVFDDDVDNIP